MNRRKMELLVHDVGYKFITKKDAFNLRLLILALLDNDHGIYYDAWEQFVVPSLKKIKGEDIIERAVLVGNCVILPEGLYNHETGTTEVKPTNEGAEVANQLQSILATDGPPTPD